MLYFYNAVIQKYVKFNSEKQLNHSEQIDFMDLEIDNEIYRLKGQNLNIQFKEVAELINNKFGTSLTVNDLINRWQELQKSSKDKSKKIFNQFAKLQLDFTTISHRTGIPVTRVKREIVAVLVSNIWKICFIVRKRNISLLKDNFISTKNIKNLVIMILKSSNFKNVKEEYSMLWNFISHYYQETHFKTVSDESYKLVYRQLIILAEKFKVNDIDDKTSDLRFERKILQESIGGSLGNELFPFLNGNRKRNNQEMIDLISQDQQQISPHIENSQMEIQNEPFGKTILGRQIQLYHRMSQLNRMQNNGGQNPILKQEKARIAFEICLLEEILKKTVI